MSTKLTKYFFINGTVSMVLSGVVALTTLRPFSRLIFEQYKLINIITIL